MRAAVIVLLLVLLASCSSWPRFAWPGNVRSERPAAPVVELVAASAADAPIPTFAQYWQRNTLVIDMQTAAGSGQVMLAPRPGGAWPMRLAFRVRPGSFGALEVRGAQRVLWPIALEGSQVIDLELAPGIYSPSTEHLVVAWGPLTAPAVQSPGG